MFWDIKAFSITLWRNLKPHQWKRGSSVFTSDCVSMLTAVISTLNREWMVRCKSICRQNCAVKYFWQAFHRTDLDPQSCNYRLCKNLQILAQLCSNILLLSLYSSYMMVLLGCLPLLTLMVSMVLISDQVIGRTVQSIGFGIVFTEGIPVSSLVIQAKSKVLCSGLCSSGCGGFSFTSATVRDGLGMCQLYSDVTGITGSKTTPTRSSREVYIKRTGECYYIYIKL